MRKVKKLLVFIGDSGSGKTTLISELTKRYPNEFKKVITYTTRSPRIGEVDGRDYHFVSTKCFNDNLDLLVLVGHAKDGTCYGTKKSDLYSETHYLLLTSKSTGIQKLTDLGLRNIVVVRIIISEELKIVRMRYRGDNEKEIVDRLEIDSLITSTTDFRSIPVVCLDANRSIEEKVEIILRAC